MGKLLSFLWSGCWHNWRLLGSGPTVNNQGGLPVGRWYERECTKCHRIKYDQS